MRCGLLARSENTGLGRMSLDAFNRLHPTAVVVVDVHHPTSMHLDRFPDAEVADPLTPAYETVVKRLLDRVDVLLVLETPYDPRVYTWAREKRVSTVCVAMPEYDIPERWGADLVINPTPYLHDRLPENSIILPWPVDTSAIEHRHRTHIDTWLHIVGQPCAHDRNGTKLVIDTFKKLPHRKLLIRAQEKFTTRKLPSNIEVRIGNVAHVSDLYQEGDALIAPRRYAGQNLPALEAMAAGLPFICLDREPDNLITPAYATIPCHVKIDWPVRRNSRFDTSGQPTQYSGLEVYDAKVADVEGVIEATSQNDFIVDQLSRHSREQAEQMSWEALGNRWLNLLHAQVYA